MFSWKINWLNLASVLFCICFGAAVIFLFGKYAVAVTLPFLIAFAVASLLHPVSVFVSSKTKIPEKICSLLILALFFLVLGILISLFVGRGMTELRKLSENGNALGEALRSAAKKMEEWRQNLPFLGNLLQGENSEQWNQNVELFFDNLGKNTINTITTWIPGAIASFLSSLPSLLLFFVVTLIASFYMILDLKHVKKVLLDLMPVKAVAKWPDIAEKIKKFIRGFVRAYTLILFLTFCELLAGFSILGLEYRFLPALFISIVDIFPVLGVGTVLIPWGIVCLLQGNYYLGFGLLILWAGISILRQIIEPKIVGGTLGIPPLITLISLYIGFRLFGLWGMLLSPAVVLLFRFVWHQVNDKKNTVNA